ncbi:MAG: SDR family NAD(P)-dependent oxidoreductase, partial [Ferruginibacter sp.]
MFSLKNKKAIITGAGSGIGKAIAVLFAKQGAEVHILEINAAAASEVLNEINAVGGKAFAHSCNVADQQQVIEIFNSIGNMHILVNNAGIAHVGKADTTSEADFDKVVNINIKGVYNCIHAAVPLLRKSNGGVILNMASIAALVGLPDR